MKKKEYKFEIGQHVFILGRAGRCIITGRGIMEFISGGVTPMYQLCGGGTGVVQEDVLITVSEAEEYRGGFI